MKVFTMAVLSLSFLFSNNLTWAQTKNGITIGSIEKSSIIFKGSSQPVSIIAAVGTDTLFTTGEIDSIFAGGDTLSYTFDVTASFQDTVVMKVKYGLWDSLDVPMMFLLNGDSIGTVLANSAYTSFPQFVEWDVTQSIIQGLNSVRMISADSTDSIATGNAVLGHIDIIATPDTISPNLSFSSDTLDFSTVFVGYSASQRLLIKNIGNDTLVISDISSDNGAFTVDTTSSQLGADERDTLFVTFTPGGVGAFAGELTFASNDSRDSLKTVRLIGNSLIAPVISVSLDSIDEVLVVGDSAYHVLTIDNSDGGSDLEWEVTAYASHRVFPSSNPAISESKQDGDERIDSVEPILAAGALDYAYMAEQTTNSVIVMDTKTNTTVTSVPVGSFPHRLEFSPDGEYVWVANKNDNTTSVIRTSDNTVVETIGVGSGPFGMAFTPDGAYVYQAVRWDGILVVIDTETRSIVSTIALSGGDAQPKDIAITPDGNFAYVVSQYGLVWVIDLSNNSVVQTIGGATGGHTIRITKDGSRAYFSEGSVDYPNRIQTIDLKSNTLGVTIGSFQGSEGFDFTPDERYIYVMDRWADQIQKIDMETNLVVNIFTNGYLYDGYGVAISPDGLYGYATVPWISSNYGIHIFETATDLFVGRLETDKRIREIITFDPSTLPYITATPQSGTLAAGTSVDVELKISALGLRPRNYGAVIEVKSNDPEASSVGIPLRLKVLPPPVDPPEILSIDDVPDDQGGWVTLSWNASPDDDFFSDTPVNFYSIWLRNDSPDAAAFAENDVLLRSVEKRSSKERETKSINSRFGVKNLKNDDYQTSASIETGREITLQPELNRAMIEGGRWIGIGSIGATQDSTYEFLVHTLSDSDSAGYNWSHLKVSAHPSNPFAYSESEVDSGYSVDNKHPSAPSNIGARVISDGLEVYWTGIEDEDLDYYAIYKSRESGFDPSSVDYFGTTTDTLFMDTEVGGDTVYYYVLSAFDFHGNESEYSPEIMASLVGTDDEKTLPVEYLLGQNYPNPFNPVTTISYALPIAGNISLIIYDLNGREIMRWDEEISQGGYYQKQWNGMNLSGEQVSSGVYLYRLLASDFVQTRKMVFLK